MADTNRTPPSGLRVEGDGISYRGIVWFIVILTAVTVACQLLMWGLLAALKTRTEGQDFARAPHATPTLQAPPGPNLLGIIQPNSPGEPADPQMGTRTEPGNLEAFRAREDAILHGPPAWADQNAGTVRIPIERAMELILQRGLPARGDVKK